MKAFRKLVIFYTVIMLAMLAAVVIFCQKRTLTADSIASYDAKELKIYRQVWEQVNENYEKDRTDTLAFGCVVWAGAFLSGAIFLLWIYLFLIRPAGQIERVAQEIAKGNLDVPLPGYQENLLSGFTESFDLMREELKRAKEREREAERVKQEMAAGLSHDLKTPVATIRATCEVLELKISRKLEQDERELLTPEGAYGEERSKTERDRLEESIRERRDQLEKIGYISGKTDTIRELVDNVFRMTLEDMQEIRVEPAEYDSRLIEGFFLSLKEYGNVFLDNPVPECLVCMDKLRMEQVIDNVVGNSYKYAGTDVHVSFRETENLSGRNGKTDKFIQITIRDEGPGVPEEELPLLVQKFYRGKAAREKQGYGLGLYLVKWYMEKQGGGMEYHNDHGFVVELWVKKV